MPGFGVPFAGLARDGKLTDEVDEERGHAGEFPRVLPVLTPDQAKLYANYAKRVEGKIRKK